MNAPATTKEQISLILEGILRGRSLHDLERDHGVSAETLLTRLRHDEDAAIGLQQAREVSAYAMESELLDRATQNLEAPRDAATNTALKIWSDIMRWAIERRNPAIFSGKAQVESTMVVKFDTPLDMNAPKNPDGVYELTATHIEETTLDALARQGEKVEPLLLTAGNSSSQGDTKSLAELEIKRIIEAAGQAIQDEALEQSEALAGSNPSRVVRAKSNRAMEKSGALGPSRGTPSARPALGETKPGKERGQDSKVARGRPRKSAASAAARAN